MTRTPVMPSCRSTGSCHPLAHVEVRHVRLALEARRDPDDGRTNSTTISVSCQLISGHQDERHHQQQAGGDELQQTPLDEFAHALDVGRHAADQHAGLVAIEERHRLRLQPVEHRDAQSQETLTGPVDGQVLQSTAT